MGLKEGNKAKTEIDYELEKLIIKAERLPIYFNWYDFHRGKLNPPPAPLSGHLKRQMMANRIQANKKRAADKLRQIHKIFDPVMETMEKDFLKEKGKNPERAKE